MGHHVLLLLLQLLPLQLHRELQVLWARWPLPLVVLLLDPLLVTVSHRQSLEVEAKAAQHQPRESQQQLQPPLAELTASSSKPSQLHVKARWDNLFSVRSTPEIFKIASDIWTC